MLSNPRLDQGSVENLRRRQKKLEDLGSQITNKINKNRWIIYKSNYKAYLRRQPTLDEITGYLHLGQDKITYPDRSATILRNSPYLGIYDGITFHELEDQEEQIEKEKLKEAAARELARKEKKTHDPPKKKKFGTHLDQKEEEKV